jgi:hypothetical protein
MSTIQIEEGGEVSACRLIVSSVLSGSRDMMRTVWSSQPTAYAKKCQLRSRPGHGTYKIWCPLTPLRNVPNAHRKDCASHCLPILVFVQLSVQVQLKVHQFCRTQSYDDLPLVCRRRNDGLARGNTPFVYPAVRQDVSNALWVNL